MKTMLSLLIAGALIINGNAAQAQSNENRTVSAFTKIENKVPLDIVLEKGSKEGVTIAVTGIDLKKIHTEVADNTLKVYLESGSFSNLKGKITITFVNLTGISNYGSGDITSKSEISVTDFALNTNGSGDIQFEGKLKATNFSFQHKGSGDVELASLETDNLTLSMMGSGDFKAAAGRAVKQTIDLSGSGDVEIENLSGENCTVAIKGSGDVKVNISNTLQGSILGSGNVQYKGEPKVKQVEVKGSGDVIKM